QRRPIDDAEVELVDHQRLRRQPLVILPGEIGCKAARGSVPVLRAISSAYDVCPEGHCRARDISPERIQTLIPPIELCVVGRPEARTGKSEHLQIVAEFRLDDALAYVRAVRNALSGGRLTSQCGASIGVQHLRTSAAPRRRD